MSDNQSTPPLADDIVRGTAKIAAELNLSETQTYYRLETGAIPAMKEGGVWTTTRTMLRRHYNTPINTPPAEQPTAPLPQRRKRLRAHSRTRR